MEGRLGARIELASVDEVSLFGEGPGGVVIAGPSDAVEAVAGAQIIGSVEGNGLKVQRALSLSDEQLRETYEGAIPGAFVTA